MLVHSHSNFANVIMKMWQQIACKKNLLYQWNQEKNMNYVFPCTCSAYWYTRMNENLIRYNFTFAFESFRLSVLHSYWLWLLCWGKMCSILTLRDQYTLNKAFTRIFALFMLLHALDYQISSMDLPCLLKGGVSSFLWHLPSL